ncbi:hypothetical protein BDZ45DRAFT_755596 [Acephala macrosclerotiorum]|nr:hypothetical protein BDZ45DRAFT_755596 [Acephala macrosclerotiorum]
MLKVYTHRALTFGTDRLPAISGIAAHFGKSLCDKYEAKLKDLKLRPLKYQGLFWSWAAINEPIYSRYYKVNGDCHVDFDVVDYNIKIHSTSANFSVYDLSFGAVESASLQLKGRLGLIECMYVKRTSDIKVDQWTFKKKDDTRPEETLYGNFHLDAFEAEFANGNSGSIPVYLLIVSSSTFKSLILRRIKESLFSRLGIYEL